MEKAALTAAPVTPAAKKTAVRNSSFELLRILCMLVIIAHHYSVHAGWFMGRGIHSVQALRGGAYLIQVMCLGGKWACDVFMLISGYFSAGRRTNYKSVARLAAEMYFYALLILGGAAVLAPRSITPQVLKESLVPVLFGNWYCVCYLVFSLFIPYLNTLLAQLDKAACRRLVGITLLVWSGLPWLYETVGGDAVWVPADIMAFFAMYLLGAYVRLHVPAEPKHSLRWALLALAANGLLAVFVYMLDRAAIATGSDYLADRAGYLVSLNGPVHVVSAFALFMLFRGWEFHSKWINWAAASVLGVYLIHDNSIIRSFLWDHWSPNDRYFLSPWLPVHAAVKILAVFAVCMLIDKGREWLFVHSVDKWLDNWWSKRGQKT